MNDNVISKLLARFEDSVRLHTETKAELKKYEEAYEKKWHGHCERLSGMVEKYAKEIGDAKKAIAWAFDKTHGDPPTLH